MITNLESHIIGLLADLDAIYATDSKLMKDILTSLATESLTARQLLRYSRIEQALKKRRRRAANKIRGCARHAR